MIISSRVPQTYNGFSILDYLTDRFTYLSKEQWLKRITEGKVLCNDIPCNVDTIIATDDVIAYDMPEFVEPPADFSYSIVHEDDWLLGINKPGNLLVHHRGKSFKSNLIYHLRYLHDPPFEKAGIVNRLDRETSGVVIVARNREALVTMNRAMAGRKVVKEYRAIVNGVPKPGSGTVDMPIGRVSNAKVRYRYGINGEKAKSAVTRYETLQRVGQKCSLLRLLPETGRTHQLRVHMAAIGHVIVGDKLYGMSDDEFLKWRRVPDSYRGKLAFHRQALHCYRMSFIHPYSQKECTISAPFPQDMQKFIQEI